MSWLVYALAASALLTLAGWGAERALLALRLPTRWGWAAVLCLSCGLGLAAWSGLLTSPEPSDPAGVLAAQAGASIAPVDPEASTVARWLAGLRTGHLAAGPARLLNDGLSRVDGLLTGGGAWLGDRAGLGEAERIVALGVWVWGALSLGLLAVLLGSWARIARSRRGWVRARVSGRPVRISDAWGPAVIGVRRPEIVLPRNALRLPGDRLQLVLLHESEHVSAGDTRLLAIGLLPLLLFPWNPFLWLQHARLREAVEVDCDARVLATGVSGRCYGATLLDLGGDRFPGLSPAPALGAGTRQLERRIRTMKPRTPRQRIPVALGGGVLAAGVLLLACEVDTPVVQSGPDEVPVVIEASEGAAQAAEREPFVRLRAQSQAEDPGPLVVVDGIIVSGGTAGLGDLLPESIDRIEVVKGAAAERLFGSRAAGGVIQITTKEGAPAPPPHALTPRSLRGEITRVRRPTIPTLVPAGDPPIACGVLNEGTGPAGGDPSGRFPPGPRVRPRRCGARC